MYIEVNMLVLLFVCFNLRPFLPTFGLIGRPREREADTEKPKRCPTLFRMSPLVLLHAQCIALIHEISVKSLIRMTWSGGRSNSPPLALQYRMLPLDHGPPVSSLVARLRSNLFVTLTFLPPKQADF